LLCLVVAVLVGKALAVVVLAVFYPPLGMRLRPDQLLP
jgi:hypothetical protein